MSLEKSKELLVRIINKFGDDLRYTRIDIKPQYGNNSGKGYPYHNIEDNDRDTIYDSIGELMHLINDPREAIQFDISNVFITEKKAISELRRTKKFIENKLMELINIRNKYEQPHYPIEVAISRYEEVNEILGDIFDSTEFKEFENPDKISQLESENFELKFQDYWQKRTNKYLLHVILFIPFFVGTVYAILNKDNIDLNSFNIKAILIICSTITLPFNYFFNNHNSFKDAWKIFFSDTREELREQEKEKFRKSI